MVEIPSAVKTFSVLEGLYGNGDVLTQRALWECRDYVVLTKQGHCFSIEI